MEAYLNGIPITRLGNIYHCDRQVIYSRLKSMGAPINKRGCHKNRNVWNKGKKGLQVAWNKGLTKEDNKSIAKYSKKNKIKLDNDLVIKYYSKNISAKKIAKIFNCNASVIFRILRESNVKIRDINNKDSEWKSRIGLKHKGKVYGLETRKKISCKKTGINLEEWKSFKSLEPYNEDFNTNFKNKIRKRDNQVCMNCGIHREKLKISLDVHHVNYDKQCSIEQNCISLCHSCHPLTNANRPYWTQLFQEKLSKLYGYKYKEGKIILEVNNGF